MRKGNLAAACVLAMMLSACGGASDQAGAEVADTAPAPAVAPAPAPAPGSADSAPGPVDAGPTTDSGAGAAGGEPALVDRKGEPVALVAFDIERVPVTGVALGELPFVSLPDGYGTVNDGKILAFARFPFRVGEGLHWVEGRAWVARLGVERERRGDKQYSALELRRNLNAVLEQAGATKVFEGELHNGMYYGTLEDEIGQGFIGGVNIDADTPTTVHVIRQQGRNVWVQLSIGARQAAMVVVEETPFEATARWMDGFPWLSEPEGYSDRSSQRDYDMYPFWTGSNFEEVEGKAWIARVTAERNRHSMHEVRRNLQAMMDEAGGTLVFEGRIPKEAAERYDADLRSTYSDGTGYSWHGYDSMVYRVDLADGRQVWVHARLEDTSAGWVVMEREGFVQTAALLPASALKQQLDADGRVAIQVNFAVDKADILPDSQPQIEQVLALLRGDPALRLSIDGHTDDTGDAAHNQRLSEARAKSVATALASQGIDASRLQAKGHGQSQPVAGNDTDEGRAKNRRVELVRL